MLKTKIQRTTVVEANGEAEEGVALDRELLKRADLWPFEKVEVYNHDNGARFTSFVVESQPGRGAVCINGASAYLVRPGHRITICAYVIMSEADLGSYRPKTLL
jgi:aspartate 1-decarboxylase